MKRITIAVALGLTIGLLIAAIAAYETIYAPDRIAYTQQNADGKQDKCTQIGENYYAW